MNREDAEELIRQKEGRLCVRFFQRHDGTVMTTDCPVGLRAWHRRLRALVAFAATLLLLAFGLSAHSNAGRRSDSWLTRVQPFRMILDWIDPPCAMGVPARPVSQGIAPNGQQQIGPQLLEELQEEN